MCNIFASRAINKAEKAMLREHMRQFQQEVGFDDSPLALIYDRYSTIILMYIARYISSREDADDLLEFKLSGYLGYWLYS